MSAGAAKSELDRAIHSGALFVAMCAGGEVRIVCHRSPSAAAALGKRGYRFQPPSSHSSTPEDVDGRCLVLPVLDPSMKATELMGLRDLGVPFSKGKEWNPCEVFEYLCDLGLADGGYWSIGWSGPGKFSIVWEAASSGTASAR